MCISAAGTVKPNKTTELLSFRCFLNQVFTSHLVILEFAKPEQVSMLAASLFALPRGSLRARTPSDVEELLQLANDHIAFTLHTFDREDPSSVEDQGVDGVYYIESTGRQSSTWFRHCRRLWGWLTVIFRKKKQYLHSDSGGDERFRRLKRRYTGLVHHIKDLDASRAYLSRVLRDLHDSGEQLHDAVRDAFEGDGDATTPSTHEICAAAFNDLAVSCATLF